MKASTRPRARAQRDAEPKTTFVLLPGAGGAAWYWHRVVPLLEKAGHEVLAVDLPADNPRAGLRAYAKLVLAAIGKRRDVTLVAQSMGAFTAAVVCGRAPKKIGRLVFVNAMIPLPGETAGAWWDNTNSGKARKAAARRGGYPVDFDADAYFFHDVPRLIVKALSSHERDEVDIALREPAAFETWPDIPIHVVASTEDRVFPRAFQARVARDRLGLRVDEVPGGHLNALSRPRELAQRLLQYVER